MIRKSVLQPERDHRVVKWSLVAAALALSIGCYAETVLLVHEPTEPVTATAQQEPVQKAVAPLAAS